MAISTKVSVEEENKFIELYESGMSMDKVAELSGRDRSTIRIHLNARGVRIRSNRENSRRHLVKCPHYFDIIDTEEKAYLLGYIYADGYITQRNQSKHSDYINYQLGVSLQEDDIEILEMLRDALQTDYPINHYEVKIGYKPGVKYVRLLINSKDVVDGLRKHGVVFKKSEIIEEPKGIPEHLVRHFIRGYIDGDGSIIEQNTKYGKSYTVSMVGTDSVLSYIADYFYDNGLIKYKTKHEKRHQHDIVSSCRWGGNNQAYKILTHLYKDAKCFLNRKHERYIRLCEIM